MFLSAKELLRQRYPYQANIFKAKLQPPGRYKTLPLVPADSLHHLATGESVHEEHSGRDGPGSSKVEVLHFGQSELHSSTRNALEETGSLFRHVGKAVRASHEALPGKHGNRP